ncbi:hypothetical protein PYCC9005_005588 [Savitreella phatthalungensis]
MSTLPKALFELLHDAQRFAMPPVLNHHGDLKDIARTLDIRAKLMAADCPLSEQLDVNLARSLGFSESDRSVSDDDIADDHRLSADVFRPTPPKVLSLYATVKISDIPWDASLEDCYEFIGPHAPNLARYTAALSPVHFTFDRLSGKTQSDVFVEFATTVGATAFASECSGKMLGHRAVSISLVSSREMLEAIFPRARPDEGIWVSREEVQNILLHARTRKSPYTRKCPQRPTDNFISILALFPWANAAAYTLEQRVLLFEGYTALADILLWQVRRADHPAITHDLLGRLVLTGTMLTEFSFEDKHAVCAATGISPSRSLSPALPTTNECAGSLTRSSAPFGLFASQAIKHPSVVKSIPYVAATASTDWRTNANRHGITVTHPDENRS